MIRHISIFFLKKENKKENILDIKERLARLGGELCGVLAYHVGEHAGPKPPEGTPGAPEFGDLIQMIDFADAAAAGAYPEHPGHLALAAATDGYVEKVVAMDIEMEEK